MKLPFNKTGKGRLILLDEDLPSRIEIRGQQQKVEVSKNSNYCHGSTDGHE